MNTRIESDFLGKMPIPADAYYGSQTKRAAENFAITGQRMNPLMIDNLVAVKKAAAMTNLQAGDLSQDIANAIIKACDEILTGSLREWFIVDPVQGGAGTSANMNTNEVIANRAIEILGSAKGDYSVVHPNDHVNMCQSTNDVFPTAGKLTALKLASRAIDKLKRLISALEKKGTEFSHIEKLGRTQLQDAVPMTLGQEFAAYAAVLKRDVRRIKNAANELRYVNLGGTAIGTCENASGFYQKHIVENLRNVTNENIMPAENLIDATQNLDVFVALSGTVKTCAVNLSKISNDLRLLSSGPRGGIGEINLPPRQNGSSIMPGKINPVIPEVVSQISFDIIGNDVTISMAAEAGQLELNAFEPILFQNLFNSLYMLANGADTLTKNCVLSIAANENRCAELLGKSAALATALCPYIGYDKAAAIAKEALKTDTEVRVVAERSGLLDQKTIAKIFENRLQEIS